MNLGLVSIQKNRAQWLVEWFAFHYVVGFRKFYFYAHQCTDNTEEILLKLSQKLDIKAFVLPKQLEKIQLMAYQHACDNFINDVDWMAFIDGDEFLFPVEYPSLQQALQEYDGENISAVAVYNVIFGSNGHIHEPQGLVTKNFRRCNSDPDFIPNRHVKSIVKGHQSVRVSYCSHIFSTQNGTVDELHRPVTWGCMKEYTPSYKKFRLNHYCCQSYDFYKNVKSSSGHADGNPNAFRGEDWWQKHDRNDDQDDSLVSFMPELEKTIDWLLSP